MTPDDFALALSDVAQAWPALLPPNRMPVSEGMAKNLKIVRPGGAAGYYDPSETHYMVEPCNMLASRIHQAVCFVGPSQSGKTVGLGEGWLAHAIVNDPGDFLAVQMDQQKAREYSMTRIDRMIRNTPELYAMRGASSRNDNVHDKQFRNGMWLKLAWPTPSNLSSSSYRYVFMTDYDRWDDDLGGEGDGFGLGLARIRTFLSRGKLAVESSPGRPFLDPSWQPSTAHEAPPCKGILGIYNRGDRRRRYWKCPHCREWFQATPGLGLFRLPADRELSESIRSLDIESFVRDYSRAICPASGCVIRPEDRRHMEAGGRWLQDGLALDALDRLSGNPRESSIASYWLGGVSAAYSTWDELLRKHLQGLLEYSLTGNELSLQTTTNTDQCMPYMSRHLADTVDSDSSPLARARTDLDRYVVPEWTRYLAAFVDVQGGRNARFVVEVHACGAFGEEQLVDRYAIRDSKRQGLGDDFAPIDPASHADDWDVLNDRVVQATYRTPVEGRELRVKVIGVDSGGEEGVTDKAYAWFRRLRAKGLHQRVRLTKGLSQKGAKVDYYVKESLVGGKQGQGDVPLLTMNPDKLKDVVAACLRRREPGPGYYHFPQPKGPKNPEGWLPASYFDELTAEVRGLDGVWSKVRKANEALDACYGIKALGMYLGTDRKGFWENPPKWAHALETNSEVVSVEERRALKDARPQSAPVERRTGRSAYLG